MNPTIPNADALLEAQRIITERQKRKIDATRHQLLAARAQIDSMLQQIGPDRGSLDGTIHAIEAKQWTNLQTTILNALDANAVADELAHLARVTLESIVDRIEAEAEEEKPEYLVMLKSQLVSRRVSESKSYLRITRNGTLRTTLDPRDASVFDSKESALEAAREMRDEYPGKYVWVASKSVAVDYYLAKRPIIEEIAS